MLKMTEAEKRFSMWKNSKGDGLKKFMELSPDGETILCVRYETNGTDIIRIRRFTHKNAEPEYLVDVEKFTYYLDPEIMDIFKALIDEIKEANGDGRD